MKLEELNKFIDLEIQWLRYYANKSTRSQLNENSNIYEDLKSIGYTKRVVKLDKRCCPCTITSDEIINENRKRTYLSTFKNEKSNMSDLRKSNLNLRGENRLSPIENFITIFPEKKMELLNRLKN